MNVYTVIAYRWGDREKHSYPVGVYSSESVARVAADAEGEWRGGKYCCEILEWTVDQGREADSTDKPRVVRALPTHEPPH